MRVALVELSESHEECLYSQVKFLKGQVSTLHLYLHPKIISQIDDYGLDQHQILNIPLVNKGFKRILYAFLLAKILGSYDKVIFNTSSSSKLLRNTVLLLNFSKVECVGVLHNTNKLKSSFTQKLISTKIKKYFVLADHLANPDLSDKNIQLRCFYPIYFPDYGYRPNKPANETWVVIPGSIDFHRRDYERLLRALTNNPKINNLKIVLLGKLNTSFDDGRRLLTEIKARKLEEYFITFQDFIPNYIFHGYLNQADYIMPLLSLQEDYLNHKISGSFNLAIAYQKKVLLRNYFDGLTDFIGNAEFYGEENLYQSLGTLSASEKSEIAFSDRKWHFDSQQNVYLDFLSKE